MGWVVDILVDIAALWPLFVLVLALMSGVFVSAYQRQRYDLIDVFWGPAVLTPALVAFYLRVASGEEVSTAQIVLIALVAVWAARLVWHIAKRFARSDTQDARYTKIIAAMPKQHKTLQIFLRIFVVQALLATLVGTTVIAALAQETLTVLAVAGFGVWLVGFIIELIADWQLRVFLKNPSSRDAVLDKGLWRYSRHPNYFGEIVLWWGIWMVSIGTGYSLLGLAGVITISILIVFVSGVPPSEARMKTKKGWRQYVSTTSVLIPFPPKTTNL